MSRTLIIFISYISYDFKRKYTGLKHYTRSSHLNRFLNKVEIHSTEHKSNTDSPGTTQHERFTTSELDRPDAVAWWEGGGGDVEGVHVVDREYQGEGLVGGAGETDQVRRRREGTGVWR